MNSTDLCPENKIFGIFLLVYCNAHGIIDYLSHTYLESQLAGKKTSRYKCYTTFGLGY